MSKAYVPTALALLVLGLMLLLFGHDDRVQVAFGVVALIGAAVAIYWSRHPHRN